MTVRDRMKKTKPLVVYVLGVTIDDAQRSTWDRKWAALDAHEARRLNSPYGPNGELYRVTITARPVRRKARKS